MAATTATVQSETVQERVSASGTIEPSRTADLDFAVSGTITQVFVAAGDKVSKGDALAKIDPTALNAARTAAESSLTAARSQLDVDQAAGASDVQLAADQTAVVAAEATLADAQRAANDATLRSTIKGTVASIDLEVGDVVGSGTASGSGQSGAAGGSGSASGDTDTTSSTASVSVVSTGSFVVETTVASQDVDRLKKGLQAETTATGSDETIYGTVQEIGLVAETNSSGAAVFPVTITVTGTPEDLYAGTAAESSIVVKQTEGVLTVTSRALSSEGDAVYVDKVVDGVTSRTTVKTGAVYGQTTEVLSGLAEGDVVEVPGFVRPTGGDADQSDEGRTGRGQLPGGGQRQGGGQRPGGAGQ